VHARSEMTMSAVIARYSLLEGDLKASRAEMPSLRYATGSETRSHPHSIALQRELQDYAKIMKLDLLESARSCRLLGLLARTTKLVLVST
jgi:hypothetical protein